MTKRHPSKTDSSAFQTIGGKVILAGPELRRLAEEDYITDADGNSVEYHWKREDRPYRKAVSPDTFYQWARKGKWHKRRVLYWRHIQRRLLSHLQDKILEQKVKDLETLIEIRSAVSEHLVPIRDEDGNIDRDDRGLPKFSTALPSFDRLVKSFLDLDERIALKSGDVTSRSETINANDPAASVPTGIGTIRPEEARILARKFLLEQDNALAEAVGADEADPDGKL
jgi:hypothetical protein